MANRRIFFPENVIPPSHAEGIRLCRVFANTIPSTIPTTRGEIPNVFTKEISATRVAAVAKTATKKMPLKVSFRFAGENGFMPPFSENKTNIIG